MSTENVVDKLKQKVSAKLSDEIIEKQIRTVLKEVDYVYSYLIYAKYNESVLEGWVIEYSFSQIDEYNTLPADKVADEIIADILNNRQAVKSVIGYKQPSIELMIELFRPLMRKLALQQSKRWQSLEYEDAYSICQLVMVKLYDKGYYIHEKLLRRSFENEVLMSLRHDRNKPELVSLDKVSFDDGNDDALTVADMLPDKNIEKKEQEQEQDEFIAAVFDEVKDIIVELVGERQFNELLRDYGNKHTRPWSWKKMKQIKDKFDELGITWKSFEKRYYQ